MNVSCLKLVSVGLVLGMAVPASAVPYSSDDPVESASSTLSETISAHRAEQAQMMQMRAQEFALFREGRAFLTPAPGVVQTQPLARGAP